MYLLSTSALDTNAHAASTVVNGTVILLRLLCCYSCYEYYRPCNYYAATSSVITNVNNFTTITETIGLLLQILLLLLLVLSLLLVSLFHLLINYYCFCCFSISSTATPTVTNTRTTDNTSTSTITTMPLQLQQGLYFYCMSTTNTVHR